MKRLTSSASLISVSVAITAVLALSACSSSETAVDVNAPAMTSASATTESAETTPDTTAVAKPVALGKYSVAELEAMSSEDFSKLPNIDKGPYLKSLLSHTDERSSFFGGADGRLYKFNPLDIASEENTAYEIIRQLSFEAQLAFAQTSNPDTVGDWTLDANAAKKALSAHFYHTTGEDVLPLYKTKLDVINAGSTAHIYKTEQTEAVFVDGSSSVNDADGNPALRP